MKRPDLSDFQSEKNNGYYWKPYAIQQDKYITYLEGVISGKSIKLPKEQLPIHCKQCEFYQARLNNILGRLVDTINFIKS